MQHSPAVLCPNFKQECCLGKPGIDGISSRIPEFPSIQICNDGGNAVRGLVSVVKGPLPRESSKGSRYLRGRNYDKAVSCLPPLRAASVEQDKADDFNGFLQELAGQFGGSNLHADFWRRGVKLGEPAVGLITEFESPSGRGASPQQAKAWMMEHLRNPAVRPLTFSLRGFR